MSLLILRNLKGSFEKPLEIYVEDNLESYLDFQQISNLQLPFGLKISVFKAEEANFLFPLMQNLWSEDKQVVFLSCSALFTKKLHQALAMSNQHPSYLVLDEKISSDNENYDLDHLLENAQDFFHLAFAGHQSHISQPQYLEKAASRASLARLAELKGNSTLWHFLQRENEIATLCLSSLKSSELGCQDGNISSSGLQSEELAQIGYNLGSQGNNRCLHIKCVEKESTFPKQLEILSQCLWYYLQGKLMNFPRLSKKNAEFQEYIVEKSIGEVSLTFVKSKQTQQWWFEIPFSLPSHLSKHQFQPCLYEDYLNAKEGELSDFILTLIERFDQIPHE
jgi:hypothetical protein